MDNGVMKREEVWLFLGVGAGRILLRFRRENKNKTKGKVTERLETSVEAREDLEKRV